MVYFMKSMEEYICEILAQDMKTITNLCDVNAYYSFY